MMFILQGYIGERVRVVCTDGEIIEGVVSYYESAMDCDAEFDCIGIECKAPGGFAGIEVCQDEIAEIKIIN